MTDLRKPACLLAAVAFALAALLPLPRAEAETGQPPVVLELFTSQGCSSCPPADALLGRLARRDDVIALSLPVDYWDYLGWKDTLASPANSERQRAYARNRGDRSVYTPQIVVSGVDHAAGHDLVTISFVIDEVRGKLRNDRVDVSLKSDGGTLHVSAGAAPAAATKTEATVWLVLYSKAEKVKIERGENAGRSITYYNVAREMSPIGMWHGDALTIDLPKGDLMDRGYDGCVVMLQAGSAGPIIGAAKLAGW